MKFIKLTQDKQAIVDDSDYERLSKFKWCYHLGYAIRYAGGGRKQRRFERMHRVVNNTPDGFFTDHINRNKLDNRRANLRTVKHRENSINRGLQSNNTSGYRGVHKSITPGKWVATIMYRQRTHYLGTFNNPQDAIVARARAEKRYFR